MKYFYIYYIISCANQEKSDNQNRCDFLKKSGVVILDFIIYILFDFNF